MGAQRGKIIHDRTGVLYRIHDEHFILTAAHDLSVWLKHGIPLGVWVNRPDVPPISVLDAVFYCTSESREDVAAIHLPSSVAAEVSKYKSFVSHDQIELSNDINGPMVFFGYPLTWAADHVSEDRLESQALSLLTVPYEGTTKPGGIFDPDLHSLLQCDRIAINNSTRQHGDLPHPKGMSGCGIWQVADFDRETGEVISRSKGNASLVAIEHHYDAERGYVITTKIGHVLNVIYQNFPDLKGPMNLIYPPTSKRG